MDGTALYKAFISTGCIMDSSPCEDFRAVNGVSRVIALHDITGSRLFREGAQSSCII